MDDRFRIIEGYPGYRVSRDGGVESCWSRTVYKTLTSTWLPLKPVPCRGYLTVNPSDGFKKRRRYVHRLVLEAFVGPCPEGMVCRHLDGDRTNNRVENLDNVPAPQQVDVGGRFQVRVAETSNAPKASSPFRS